MLRYHARRLPSPTKLELAKRGAVVAKAFAHRFGPVAWAQLRGVRDGFIAPELLAKPLRLAFEDVGGTFIKFGQILASSPGIFGEEVSDEFRSCLDTGPVVPFDEVRRRVEEDLGMRLEEAFASFDPAPIGRASIAVVHRATLFDGRQVAVKVLRPNIEHSPGRPAHSSLGRSSSSSMASACRSARRWIFATRLERSPTSAT